MLELYLTKAHRGEMEVRNLTRHIVKYDIKGKICQDGTKNLQNNLVKIFEIQKICTCYLFEVAHDVCYQLSLCLITNKGKVAYIRPPNPTLVRSHLMALSNGMLLRSLETPG